MPTPSSPTCCSRRKQIAIEQRLVELDRATLSVDRLVSELARYAHLFLVADKKGEPLWRSRYAVFPRIICVLAGAPRKALIRRREVALVLLDSDPSAANGSLPKAPRRRKRRG